MVYIDRRLKELKGIRQIQSRQIKETKQMNESNAIGDDIALFFCLDTAFRTLWGRRKKKEKEYADTLILSLSLLGDGKTVASRRKKLCRN